MGLDIGPDDLSVLVERTEGWPAGIYLAALSLQRTGGQARLHRVVQGLQPLHRQPPGGGGSGYTSPEDVRRFLLETSVLRAMTGPLCDAVTGREGSARLLRKISHAPTCSWFLLDEQGEWYRYHHLFSELLLYELKSSQPDLVPILRKRASVWLEDAGYVEAAIRQAIRGRGLRACGTADRAPLVRIRGHRPLRDRARVARIVARGDDRPRCGALPW